MGHDGHSPVIACMVAAPLGADEHLASAGFDSSGRKIQAGFADGLGHPAQGQPVTPQGFLGYLNIHLLGAHSGQLGQGNARQVGDIILDFFRQVLDGGL